MKLPLLLALTLAAIEAQPVVLDGFSQLAPLDGEWKFTTGDDARFGAPEFDDSGWRTVRVPREELPLPAGVSWIRFRVELVPRLALPAETLALLLPPLGTSYELFVNGQPVGAFGDPRKTTGWGDLYTPAATFFPLPSAGSRRWTIAIRTRAIVPAYPLEPAARSAWLGTLPTIAAKLRQSELELRWRTAGHLTMNAATALAALFFLLLPLWREDAREFSWCGAYLLVILSLRPITVAPWMLEGFPVPIILAFFLGFGVLAILFWERLFRLLLGTRLSMGGRLIYIGGMLLNGTLLVASPFFATALGPYFATPLLLTTLVFLGIYFDLARSSPRVEETPWMHLAVLLLHGGSFVYFVLWLVSAGPGAQNVVLLVRGGGALLFTGVMAVVLNRRSARLQREQQRLAQEMRAGAEMQALLLPAESIQVPGFVTEARYLPMSEVGGDFHYALADGDSLIIVVGDVSGKGLAAALLVALTIGILRDSRERRPGRLLAALNRALHGQTRGGFVTCSCARFDPDGTVTLANAGHPSPYCDGEEVALDAGLPLGIAAEVAYAESVVSGGRFTFFSDGVVEAENAQRELFGFERTREISGKSAAEIAEAARAWGQNDDITVVTVRRTA